MTLPSPLGKGSQKLSKLPSNGFESIETNIRQIVRKTTHQMSIDIF